VFHFPRPVKRGSKVKQDAGRYGTTPTNISLRDGPVSSPPQAHSKPRRLSPAPVAARLHRSATRPARTLTHTDDQLWRVSHGIAHDQHHELALPNTVPDQSAPDAHVVDELYDGHAEPLEQRHPPPLLVHTLRRQLAHLVRCHDAETEGHGLV
jgi:hypothetical protein